MADFLEFKDRFEDNPDILCPVSCLYFNGFEAEAKALRDNFGGTLLYIPMRPQPNEFYTRTIGLPAASFLAQQMGGVKCYVGDDNREYRRIWYHVALFTLAKIPAPVIAIILNTRERKIYEIRRLLREAGMNSPRNQKKRSYVGFLTGKVR